MPIQSYLIQYKSRRTKTQELNRVVRIDRCLVEESPIVRKKVFAQTLPSTHPPPTLGTNRCSWTVPVNRSYAPFKAATIFHTWYYHRSIDGLIDRPNLNPSETSSYIYMTYAYICIAVGIYVCMPCLGYP